MNTAIWIPYLFAAGFGFMICAALIHFYRVRQTPLNNPALLQFLQQQSNSCWLTDYQAQILWHNQVDAQPTTTVALPKQLFFSAEGLDPVFPDILAMLQMNPHWHGPVWLGDTNRQAYQLHIYVVAVYRKQYLLWAWLPLLTQQANAPTELGEHIDPITSLPAEPLWRYWIQSQLSYHQAKYQNLALLLLDLPDHPSIVRSFGQTAADDLLRQLVANVHSEIPPGAFLARLAPQQFGLLFSLEGHGDQAEQQALQIARELLIFCQGPFFLPQAEIRLDCRVGIAIYPEAGHHADELLAHAAHALMIAATVPERVHLWQMQGKNPAANMLLQGELQQALTQYQYEIWSQPVFDLTTGQRHALRLELYWRSPQRGLLNYAELKPLAAHTGQLLALERWAFCQICQLLELWQRLAPLPPIQLELSATNFSHSGLINFLKTQLADHQLQAAQFVLCLKEDGWLEDATGFSAQAEELKALGFALMIVDVGNGPSSLQLLQQPFWQAAELSAQMIEQLEESEPQRNACASLIRLLIHQGLIVNAQGTDTEMQAYLLHVMGCCAGRGLHFKAMQRIDGQQLPAEIQQPWQAAG